MKDVINLKDVTPNFNEDFDINATLLEVDEVISNTKDKSVLQNFSETKFFLWLLRHYITKQNAQETDKEQPLICDPLDCCNGCLVYGCKEKGCW